MKLFVWDLHGTLEQGNELVVIEVSNTILDRFGYAERFNEGHVRELYGLKWYEYFEQLLPEEGHERHLELQAACFELSNSAAGEEILAKHMKPALAAHEVLAAIKAKHHQVLISNTVPASLPRYVKALGMEEYFDETNYRAVNVHVRDATRSKKDVLLEYIETRAYDDYIIIGDSSSDMELVEVVGGKAYLYTHHGLPHRGNKGKRIHDLIEVLAEL